jgi:hypothetical protein
LLRHVEEILPRRSPEKVLVKNLRGKMKETRKGSQKRLAKNEDTTLDYILIIQIPTAKKPLLQPVFRDIEAIFFFQII